MKKLTAIGSVSMTNWSRDGGELGKSAVLSEGQIVSLLLSATGKTDAQLLAPAYESVKVIAELRGKAFLALITATVVAIAAKFEIVSSFSAAGMTLASGAFKPVALTAYSLSGLYYAYFQSRYRFFEMWFEAAFQKSEPSKRAELLLCYPLAFDVFKLDPSARGYPAFTWPKRSDLWRLPGIILLLAALLIFGVLAGALWIALAVDVWREAFPNQIVSALVVVGSVMISLCSACLPLSGPKKRRYQHYGLSTLMTAFQQKRPDRYLHWLQRIGAVAARMNTEK